MCDAVASTSLRHLQCISTRDERLPALLTDEIFSNVQGDSPKHMIPSVFFPTVLPFSEKGGQGVLANSQIFLFCLVPCHRDQVALPPWARDAYGCSVANRCRGAKTLDIDLKSLWRPELRKKISLGAPRRGEREAMQIDFASHRKWLSRKRRRQKADYYATITPLR